MKPATQHYLIIDGGVIVAKRAIGPDPQPDGSWTLPPAPEGAVLVEPAAYLAAQVGEGGRVEEQLARLLAAVTRARGRIEAAEAMIGALTERVAALERRR